MSLVPKILELSHLRSTHIAKELNCGARYVRRVLAKHGRNHPTGPPHGEANPAWRGGRMVDLDGYVLLQTNPVRVSEHRQMMERHLGRKLSRAEVVDHIDGITIHNDLSNLRLFASNAEHLRATALGPRRWSEKGRKNIGTRTDLGADLEPVDTYRLRKARGDVRLHAILRAALELGTEHPCLYGTTHWLEQIGIDLHSRPNLERAWSELMHRYAADLGR